MTRIFRETIRTCTLALLTSCAFTAEVGAPADDAAALALVAEAPRRDGPGKGDTIVLTDKGYIRGLSTRDYREFRGIPYAAPPVGPLRWQAPAPAQAWRGVRDATTFGAACPQNAANPSDPPTSLEEDCLYLNVTTPARPRGRLLPVMVWIHGGGFYAGASAEHIQRRLAADGGVVVVSLSYRLGALGFLGYPGLSGSGSFGLQDQQAALRWVQRNARAFHGDSSNVTIFGESAGGSSVCAQLASPEAGGLFHRAIIQSEHCRVREGSEAYIFFTRREEFRTWKTLAWAERLGTEIAAQLGCADLECLRAVPVEQLLAAAGASGEWVYWTPAYGTDLLPEHPGRAIEAGAFHRVPVLAGTTRDEGTVFVAGMDWFTSDVYADALAMMFGGRADDVQARYPLHNYASARHAWSSVMTDAGFTCPALAAARELAEHVPVYFYEFADRTAPSAWVDIHNEVPLGAFHGAEVPYLLELTKHEVELAPEQRELSARMIAYWTSFAKAGNPNARGLPRWSALPPAGTAAGHGQRLAIGADATTQVDLAVEHACELWDNTPNLIP